MPPIAARSAFVPDEDQSPQTIFPIRRLRAVLVFMLLLVAQTSAAGDAPWLEVKTEHFRVITDAGEKNGREVATNFEKMRAAYGLLFGREKINETVPLQIIAFRNTKEFRQYSPIFRGKVVELTGFCIPANGRELRRHRHESPQQLGNRDARIRSRAAQRQLHGDRSLVRRRFCRVFLFHEDRRHQCDDRRRHSRSRGVDSGPKAEHAATARGPAPFRDLQPERSEPATCSISSPGCLCTTSSTPNRSRKAGQYFTLTNNKRVPVPQAVQTAFGMSVDQLNDALFAYLRTNKLRIIRYNFKQQIVAATQATVRPIDPLEVRTQLADLHLHEQDYTAQAVKELEAIVTENPTRSRRSASWVTPIFNEHDLTKATEHLTGGCAPRLKRPPGLLLYGCVAQRAESRLHRIARGNEEPAARHRTRPAITPTPTAC